MLFRSADDHVLICEDGDQLVLRDDIIEKGTPIPAGYLYVDGSGVGDVGNGVLRDRRVLAEDGFLVVLVTVDLTASAVVGAPEVITKGWVHEGESADLIDGCADAIHRALDSALERSPRADVESLQKVVRRAAGSFVSERTRRRPMIIPVVIEI